MKPIDTMVTNPVRSAARRAARDFLGEVLSMWDEADGGAPRSPDADRKRVWDLVRRLGLEASERLARGATAESVDAHLLATLDALHEEDGADFVRAIVTTLPPDQRARMAAYLDARRRAARGAPGCSATRDTAGIAREACELVVRAAVATRISTHRASAPSNGSSRLVLATH